MTRNLNTNVGISKRALLGGIALSGASAAFAGLRYIASSQPELVSPTLPTLTLQNRRSLGDGWRVEMRFQKSPGSADFPVQSWIDTGQGSTFVIAGPGWNTNGLFSFNQTRTILSTGHVRSMWQQGVSEHGTPVLAPISIDQDSENLSVQIALSSHLYRGEQVTGRIVSGHPFAEGQVAFEPVDNTSTLTAPKAMIDWVETQRDHVQGIFSLSVAGGMHLEGRNGRPLAAVKITGTPWDAASNAPRVGTSVTKLAAYEWSGPTEVGGRGSPVWSAYFDEQEFEPGLVRFTFEDCPWVGDHQSQRCSELSPNLDPRTSSFAVEGDYTSIGRGLHAVVKWVGPLPQERHVYIAADGNQSGVVGNDQTGILATTLDAARALPFATFEQAWRALFDPQRGGSSNASGAKVWLSDGRHMLPPTGFAPSTLNRGATDIAVTVAPDILLNPQVSSATIVATGQTRFVLFRTLGAGTTSFIRFERVKFELATGSIGLFAGGGTSRSSYVSLVDCQIDDYRSSSSATLASGLIVCAVATTMYSANSLPIFDQVSTNMFATFFHNCETNVRVTAPVVWGMRYSSALTTDPFVLGAIVRKWIRNTNVFAGYIYIGLWKPVKTSFIFFRGSDANITSERDKGICVCFVTVPSTVAACRFARFGEDNNVSYSNFVVEGITTRRPPFGVADNEARNGFNLHNDPHILPSSPPGNDYEYFTVRNSNLVRMAVKGDVFMALNAGDTPQPQVAPFLTGGRGLRHGVALNGLIVGSCNDVNTPNVTGLYSVWGSETAEYNLSYNDPSRQDFSPTGGFVGLPSSSIGQGFDITGKRLWLDGTDAPGAFRSVKV